jgi:hypothetical protein
MLVRIEPLSDIRAPGFQSYLGDNLSETGGGGTETPIRVNVLGKKQEHGQISWDLESKVGVMLRIRRKLLVRS